MRCPYRKKIVKMGTSVVIEFPVCHKNVCPFYRLAKDKDGEVVDWCERVEKEIEK